MLRTNNNNIKRKLITTYLEGCKDILDMGFGRGGDLPKYKKLDPRSIVGIDPDESSLNEALERAKGLDMSSILTVRHGSTNRIHPEESYDAVVCNFAFQYFFIHEKFLDGILSTIKQVLRPGGKFIGVVPDAVKVLDVTAKSGGKYTDSEGNVVYRKTENTGWGGFNEKVAFSVQGPFYDGKPKTEPLCYMDLLYSQAIKHGLKPVDQGDVSRDPKSLSHIYSWFVFTV